MNPVVYRVYDEAGALLYVGQSARPDTRDRHHRSRAVWYRRVARREVAGPFTRDAALAHEFYSINRELPEYNVTRENGYRGPGSQAWLVAESEEFQRRWVEDHNFRAQFSRTLHNFEAMRESA
jgi:hypothetical protein